MALGPILIFDKSMLQSLNPNEAVWLDNFFLTNITPLFYVETLADLEKDVAKGRTPEQVVGGLALKTPDVQSHPAVHHDTLVAGELTGVGKVVMDGKILEAGGRNVVLDGKKGVVFDKSPEAEAFERWGKREFLDIERQIAKVWRRALTGLDYKAIYEGFQRRFKGNKPKTLTEVKALADADLDQPDQSRALGLGLAVMGIPHEVQKHIFQRWESAGKPPVRTFAPYFSHLVSVDLTFYLGIAADLIGTERPANKVDNKVDLAYLYYLPFCMVFTSSDRLHARLAPLFLRNDQSFVSGQELKADLGRLQDRYAALPDDVKMRGLFHFAPGPPRDDAFLVTRLWNKHLPGWQHKRDTHVRLNKDEQTALVREINRIDTDSTPLLTEEQLTPDTVEFVHIKRSIKAMKGDWLRVPPEALKKASNGG
jgi:hypothetical protein